MQITLRKANKIQNSILEMVKGLEFKTLVRVNEFEDATHVDFNYYIQRLLRVILYFVNNHECERDTISNITIRIVLSIAFT